MQDMDTQEACCSGNHHVAKRLTFTLTESVDDIMSQDVVDGRIVIVNNYFIDIVTAFSGFLVNSDSGNESCQLPGSGIVEHIAISHLHASLVGHDDNTRHHE